MSFDGGSSKGRIDIQDKPKFNKILSNQVPSKFPMTCVEKFPKPRFQKGMSGNSTNENLTCTICGKCHFCDWLV